MREDNNRRTEGRAAIAKDIELVERMASVAEELDDLVKISRGKSEMGPPVISRADLTAVFKEGRPISDIPRSLLAVFRLLVVKNLIRGRFFVTAYTSGKEIGLSSSLKSKNDFINIAKKIGLGNVELERFDLKDVKIRLRNGITAMGIKQSHRPICFFEAGIFSGFLENIFHKKMDLKETRCIAMGDPYCCFELIEVEYKGRQIHPLYPVDLYSQENLRLLTSLASHSIAAIENAVLFEETKKQVIVDSLTKVYNHRYFQTRINLEYKRAQRYNMMLTLFMLDVDDFKKFNDIYGHPKGDEVLTTVAATFIRNVRDVDIVARYGGDEFAIILPQTDGQGARIVAERLQKEISRKKVVMGKRKFGISISLGGVTLAPKLLTEKSAIMVESADRALLRAKKKGKGGVVLLNKV